jgi:uncharacterized protein YkwD
MSLPSASSSAGAPAQMLQPMAARSGGAGSGGSAATLADVPAGPSSCPAPPFGASLAETAVLNIINNLRIAAGASCVSLDLTIGRAASAHCAYYAQNRENPMCTEKPHYEVMGCAGYTGATPTERMRAAGFGSSGGGEVMAFLNDPVRAIQSWVDSVWHRIPILDPATTLLGYGSASECDNLGFGPGLRIDATDTVLYPYDGQTDVTTTFDGRFEGPMPPAPITGWPSGNPISVYAQDIILGDHYLYVDGDSTPIEHVSLDSQSPALPPEQQRMLRNVAFLYANQPLLPNTKYRVQVVGTYAGGVLAEEWTFTTGEARHGRMR